MKRYNLLNNAIGWVTFVIAAITYLLTIEPTASFWDCGEFIAQGYKLEIGHPPGNPIFILAARFFINFASDPATVAVCVNVMSALLSAGTILLLFWSITHLVRRLLVKDDADSMTWQQMALIMGSGLAGALAYTWSDTFWFSAVEGEVYAFSSFCTALTFWLILKWENRCDSPHSDRYLLAIAYTIGVSVGVHLLNLLCIPAIVLVVYYRKFKNTNLKGSLLALVISFVIITLILFGLVPGFVEVSQYFELFFVNVCGLSYNSGVVIYALLLVALFAWAAYEYYVQQSEMRMKLSFFLSLLASGMFFFGDSLWIPAIIAIVLGIVLFKYCKKVPVRFFSNLVLGAAVIFIGYSSYALILIRSNANTPMNQNGPDNVFALSSYLNREQYGQTPLLYGPVYNAPILYEAMPNGTQQPVEKTGKAIYRKVVKENPDDPDRYVKTGYTKTYVMSPDMNMLFPRIHSAVSEHRKAYDEWLGGIKGTTVEATTLVDSQGNPLVTEPMQKPTFMENLRFFVSYQFNYMYWRYFMWNFAGRQNDLQGQGEITHGNWISGIPFIDNARLGDQSLLPDDLGKKNAGHNVFFMLPLLLGIIGIIWQAYKDKRGIEQFWVVCFLFFMTGIAIVLYLNQTPSVPRERDYVYAGSFYAFAIWIGMGVPGICHLICKIIEARRKKTASTAPQVPTTTRGGSQHEAGRYNTAAVIVAILFGLFVPIQMVSQTWDDHDRSGRYAARDFGMNYLSSVDENGIIFTNGDNDTFPLWYVQEVEGWRTDVRVVNLSYLATDWYIRQLRYPAYESVPLPMQAPKDAYLDSRREFNYFINPDTTMLLPASKALAEFYTPNHTKNQWGLSEFKYPRMYIPVNAADAIKAGIVEQCDSSLIRPVISLDMLADKYTASEGGMSASKVMSIDIISSSIAEGWKRPLYFAMTVPERYYDGLMPYMASTGMAYEVTPVEYGYDGRHMAVNTDKAYRNVTERFRWGGLDKATPESYPYLDETVRRMVSTTRTTLVDLANALIFEGFREKMKTDASTTINTVSNITFSTIADNQQAKRMFIDSIAPLSKDSQAYKDALARLNDRTTKAVNVLHLLDTKLPEYASPYQVSIGKDIAVSFAMLGELSGDSTYTARAKEILDKELDKYAGYCRYCQSLKPQLYARLSSLDIYAERYYMLDLLQTYSELATEDELHGTIERLEKSGVDINRLLSAFQQQQ